VSQRGAVTPPPGHAEPSRRADHSDTTVVVQGHTAGRSDKAGAGQPARSRPGTAPGALRRGTKSGVSWVSPACGIFVLAGPLDPALRRCTYPRSLIVTSFLFTAEVPGPGPPRSPSSPASGCFPGPAKAITASARRDTRCTQRGCPQPPQSVAAPVGATRPGPLTGSPCAAVPHQGQQQEHPETQTPPALSMH
jgi:hypothetical protein